MIFPLNSGEVIVISDDEVEGGDKGDRQEIDVKEW